MTDLLPKNTDILIQEKSVPNIKFRKSVWNFRNISYFLPSKPLLTLPELPHESKTCESNQIFAIYNFHSIHLLSIKKRKNKVSGYFTTTQTY